MNTDFLIIGGGVVGCATALALAQTSAKVMLIERGELGGESSWAGGGILFPLLPWDYREEVTRITQWSNSLYPEWVADLQTISGIDPEYRNSGMLVLPPFDQDSASAWCGSHGVPIETVPARSRLPLFATDSAALWLPQVAQVRNPRLLQAMRRALTLTGVHVVEHTEIISLRPESDRITRASTRDRDYKAGQYIVAAGAWSQPLLGELAPSVPIVPVRGQMLLLKSEPGLLPHILLQHGIYLIPRQDGHVLVGSTLEQTGFDKSITEAAKQTLLTAATKMFPPLQQATLVRHWAGLRPGSPDNIPIISRHPRFKNLSLNSGHFRYGVTMAPASARLLANTLLGRPQSIDASPYRWPENKA